jgi:hypothetical protein
MVFGRAKKTSAVLEEDYRALKEENARLREALEFYADADNWSHGRQSTETEDSTRTERRRSAAEAMKNAIALKALRDA